MIIDTLSNLALDVVKSLGAVGTVLIQSDKDSLADLSKDLRVMPFCLTSEDVMHQEYTEDVLHVSLNVLSSFYMQGLSVINVGNGISPTKVLGKLNPDRDIVSVYDDERVLESMDYQVGLSDDLTQETPFLYTSKGVKQTRAERMKATPTRESIMNAAVTRAVEADKAADNTDGKGTTVNEMEIKRADLAVGKTLKVGIDTGNNVIKDVIVTLRLDNIVLPKNAMRLYLKIDGPAYGFFNRIRGLRAGRLKFFKDFFLWTDIIDDERRLMKMDKQGILKEILDRRAKGIFVAATGKGRSHGISSNCLIVSTEVMESMRTELRGDIDNYRVREGIFSGLSLLLMAVVDAKESMVTFYYRGRKHGNTLSLKALKRLNKKDGPDIEDLAKLLAGSKNISF